MMRSSQLTTAFVLRSLLTSLLNATSTYSLDPRQSHDSLTCSMFLHPVRTTIRLHNPSTLVYVVPTLLVRPTVDVECVSKDEARGRCIRTHCVRGAAHDQDA